LPHDGDVLSTHLRGYIASSTVFTELQEDAANDCTKTFSKSTYEVYQAVLDAYEFPDTSDSDELIESEFGKALTERLIADVGDYKYVKRAVSRHCDTCSGFATRTTSLVTWTRSSSSSEIAVRVERPSRR